MTVRWGSAVITSVLFATLLVLTGAGGKLHLREASGSTYLCTGYSGCNSSGHSDSGYGAVSNKMYWRMYSGHNCVNYVAYRMIQAGMSTTRPWTGSGNAANWGHAMSRITDQTPAVGAVAWWDAYHHVGSAGHVAYIEKVNSPTDITISEDSWSGTFHWQRITKDSGFWPSGFIHFRDKSAGPVLVNKVRPFIEGTPKVGRQLTAHVGTWSGKPNHYSYQWTANGAAIAGATRSTFTPDVTEVKKRIGLTITGSHPKSTSVRANARQTAAVVRGTFANAALPSISGKPLVDHTLTASPGRWSPAPVTYTYGWRADGQWIDGATSDRLVLTKDMIGQKITLVAHAKTRGFKTATRTSDATSGVAAGQVEISTPYTVSGVLAPGRTLRAVGAYSPSDANATYQWTRDGRPIRGATQPKYVAQAADLGHHVAVDVHVTKKDYLSADAHAVRHEYVRTPTHVQLRSVGIAGGAVIHLHVHSAYLRSVPGTVRVRVGREQRSVDLVNNSAKVRFTDLKPGHYGVRVFYGRTATTLASSRTGGVRVQ